VALSISGCTTQIQDFSRSGDICMKFSRRNLVFLNLIVDNNHHVAGKDVCVGFLVLRVFEAE
jgi:hypothetical protein